MLRKKLMFIILLVLLLICFLIVFMTVMFSTKNEYYGAQKYDDGIIRAESEGNYTQIEETKKINDDLSVTLHYAIFGLKRVVLTYTVNSESGDIPANCSTASIAESSKIYINGEEYTEVEEPFVRIDNKPGELKGSLLLDAYKYEKNFDIQKVSELKVIFEDIAKTGVTISFDFNSNKTEAITQTVDYKFKVGLKNHTISSVELDPMNTTLNFKKHIYYTDIKLIQNGIQYQVLTLSNNKLHYISFPSVEKGVPFTVYINGEEVFTYTFN